MMISIETYMTDNEASVPENLPGEWIRLMKRQALLMLGWTAFYPLGRFEGNRIIQILSAFNCRFLGPNSR
jgi:hypothetical protein